MHWRLSRKYGIQIPIKTKIGYGFYIGHGVGIIVNENAEQREKNTRKGIYANRSTSIGNSLVISQFT